MVSVRCCLRIYEGRLCIMSLVEQNQRIVSQYREAGEPWPATSTEIARWAIGKQLWHIQPGAVVRQCADQIANAMREEFHTDPQGRRVRLLHAAPYPKNGRQYLLWDDMRTAGAEYFQASLNLSYTRRFASGRSTNAERWRTTRRQKRAPQRGSLCYVTHSLRSNETSRTDRLVLGRTICWMRQQPLGLL
jgi:hypothetical protein